MEDKDKKIGPEVKLRGVNLTGQTKLMREVRKNIQNEIQRKERMEFRKKKI